MENDQQNLKDNEFKPTEAAAEQSVRSYIVPTRIFDAKIPTGEELVDSVDGLTARMCRIGVISSQHQLPELSGQFGVLALICISQMAIGHCGDFRDIEKPRVSSR